MNSIKNVSHYSHEISSAEQTFTDILPLVFSSELIPEYGHFNPIL